MKKNSLICRILDTIILGILVFEFVFSVGLVLLHISDKTDLAFMISIPWAIGYFITKTLHSLFKKVWILVGIEILVVLLILGIAKLFSIVFVDIITNSYKCANIVIGTLCFSIVINNLDWTKDLAS